MRDNFQTELFQPEPLPRAGSSELNFDISLKDGAAVKVRFHYITPTMPHFDFYGEAISSTGYRSCFPCCDFSGLSDSEIIKIAAECAEFEREEYVKTLAKKSRKRKTA